MSPTRTHPHDADEFKARMSGKNQRLDEVTEQLDEVSAIQDLKISPGEAQIREGLAKAG
jgi:hypothetical protein